MNIPVWKCTEYVTCSTDMSFGDTWGLIYTPDTHQLFREYREADLAEECPYCGNLSDERDAWGNCIACGGPRRK